MTHPGEKFYPEGVHWDDPIARGTLPDLLSNAAAEYGARPAIEFRDAAISYAELEAMVEVAASAYLRAGYGKDKSVALFLGIHEQHHFIHGNAPAELLQLAQDGLRVLMRAKLHPKRVVCGHVVLSGP